MTLSDTIAAVQTELSQIIPEGDLVIPGGDRAMAAAYVHVHMPLMQAGVEGYGFIDAALTDTQKVFASLSHVDRAGWVRSCHDALARQAEWVSPQLSRMTSDWISNESANGVSGLDYAMSQLPTPHAVSSKPFDEVGYGITLQSEGKLYLVPSRDIERGEIGSPRPIAGLGAGLSGGGKKIDEILVGDEKERARGIAGTWQYRPMAPTRYGPVMIIGNEFQAAPTDLESALAMNAVERFQLLHETPRSAPMTSLVIEQGIRPADQALNAVLAQQAFSRA